MDAQAAPSANDLIAEINEIAPLLREERSGADIECRMSDRVADELRRRGFYRMYRPRERGGYGFDPVSGFRVVEALSRIDSTVGWNVAIANACECFGSYLDDETTAEIFGSPDTVLAGGLFPPRKAIPVEGGFQVTGKSLFNSNCHAANWLLVEAVIYDGNDQRLDDDGNPQGLFLFVPASDAEIVDNWDTLGMRGTGSHDIDLQGVFVPTSRTAPLLPLEQAAPAYSGPMHRLTFWPPVAINGVPALGIAQAAIDDFIDLAATKVHAYTTNSLRNRQTVQLRLAKAQATLRAARAYLYDTFDEMWDVALGGDFLTIDQKADCQQAATHAIVASAEAVKLIHSIAGSAAIRRDKPFERYFRDIHVITQHAFVCESRFEAVGQIRLGLDSDWEFLYF
jgi:alkylation response protein AidB-like acyl-CoA dehydrogenase